MGMPRWGWVVVLTALLVTGKDGAFRADKIPYPGTVPEDERATEFRHRPGSPVLAAKARSYTFKEVYYSPVSSETAVKQLREAKIDG